MMRERDINHKTQIIFESYLNELNKYKIHEFKKPSIKDLKAYSETITGIV